MNFGVQSIKATQSVARLIEQSGGEIDYLRLVKLVYLADRKSIVKRGVPIIGGQYLSMKLGPTISEVMDFVGMRNAPGWKTQISPRYGNTLKLNAPAVVDELAPAEIQILDSVVKEYAELNTDGLVAWCHDHCPEYEDLASGRRPISVEAILGAAGKDEEQIEKLVKEADSLARLEAAFA
jgi:uncharacterized phage-associated protein